MVGARRLSTKILTFDSYTSFVSSVATLDTVRYSPSNVADIISSACMSRSSAAKAMSSIELNVVTTVVLI